MTMQACALRCAKIWRPYDGAERARVSISASAPHQFERVAVERGQCKARRHRRIVDFGLHRDGIDEPEVQAVNDLSAQCIPGALEARRIQSIY